MESLNDIGHLGMALALGLVVGFERGWHARARAEGERIAGVRTFGLIGLLGGLSVLLGQATSMAVVPVALAGLAAMLLIAYGLRSLREDDAGITTLTAAVVTFIIGALCVSGRLEIAAASAVVMGLVLSAKPAMHGLIHHVSEAELRAVFQLLLISIVALPLIPNQGYGPGNVLNPYEIWWMVVLIAMLSSAGYFAMRIVGPQRGLLVTGALGGLASSTALTLSYARMFRQARELHIPLSVGILLACAMMFPRVWLEAFVLQPHFAWSLIPPLLVMATIASAGLLVTRSDHAAPVDKASIAISNPFELRTALQFGALLVAVTLLSHWGQVYLGDEGIYLVAVVASISDVDAITLTVARSVGDTFTPEVAQRAIVLSAAVNSVTKGILAAVLGGAAMWRTVALPLFVAAVAGVATAWLV
ncbi:MgtC/SapB family protein [Algiphilus sp.]|uniref:MgtC/SapB family protein n=1 Tax=Algiphilus sp. TaxID=1872431 RepID=UPI003B526CB5